MDKALEAGCCSSITPCAWQRKDPTTICPTCQRAARPATDTSGLVERLRGEAQMWKMEAMAHKSSLHEAYQACSGATGEPGNWNGAEPIKATIASLTARAEKAEARLAEAEAVIQTIATINRSRDQLQDIARSYLEGRK